MALNYDHLNKGDLETILKVLRTAHDVIAESVSANNSSDRDWDQLNNLVVIMTKIQLELAEEKMNGRL